MIAECDMAEVKEQYAELMKQSINLFPGTSEYILHSAVIGWLNKEFNPNFETDFLNVDSLNIVE